MIITPKNWQKFQHYKNRKPPWIKLYRDLLDDFDFQCLPDASRALAPLLWLLASEEKTGVIKTTPEKLAYRLRRLEHEIVAALKPLVERGFFVCEPPLLANGNHLASIVLALRMQDATPEREGETDATQEVSEGRRLLAKGEINTKKEVDF